MGPPTEGAILGADNSPAICGWCRLTHTAARTDHRPYGPDGVALQAAAGETLAVMGPSGCGNSTLLHLLGGLERPSAGEVWLAGRRIDRLSEEAVARLRRRAIGFVFQAFDLMDELTALENVELPALLAGRSPRAARRRAAELLEQVGLSDRATHLPSALSGGQRQRVAIARALSNEPLVVLADEPTGNLDTSATFDVLRLLDSLRAAGQTLVIVTHEARVAGFALIAVADPDGAPTPALWQLLAVVPGTVLVIAALTAIPARIGARRPVAGILQSELA